MRRLVGPQRRTRGLICVRDHSSLYLLCRQCLAAVVVLLLGFPGIACIQTNNLCGGATTARLRHDSNSTEKKEGEEKGLKTVPGMIRYKNQDKRSRTI